MLTKELCENLGCEPRHLAAHGFRLGSFGTMALEGRPPPQEAIAVADEHGVDIRAHRGRAFSIELVKKATTIFWMSRSHRDFLAPFAEKRPDLLQPLDPKGRDIPDPYRRSLKTYRKVAQMLEEACRARAKELLETAEEPEGSRD
jgi:protein-tyrosine phosphatase